MEMIVMIPEVMHPSEAPRRKRSPTVNNGAYKTLNPCAVYYKSLHRPPGVVQMGWRPRKTDHRKMLTAMYLPIGKCCIIHEWGQTKMM